MAVLGMQLREAATSFLGSQSQAWIVRAFGEHENEARMKAAEEILNRTSQLDEKMKTQEAFTGVLLQEVGDVALLCKEHSAAQRNYPCQTFAPGN